MKAQKLHQTDISVDLKYINVLFLTTAGGTDYI